MKQRFLLFAFLLSTRFLMAQGIAPDTEFGINGQVQTLLQRTTGYSNIWDITPDQHIILGGIAEPFQNGVLFCKYSPAGDSLYGLSFYNNSNKVISANAIKAMEGGNVLVAGKELIQVDQSGMLDTTFGISGKAGLQGIRAHDILINQENRILVAGHNITFQGEGYVLAFSLDGKVDSSFGSHGYFKYRFDDQEFFNRMIEQPDGKLLIGGCSALSSGSLIAYQTLLRLMPNGIPDPTFGSNGIVMDSFPFGGENYGIVLQDDQKIVVCGTQYSGSDYSGFVVRYMPDGTRDASFGMNGVVSLPVIKDATDLVLLPNGKILVYGGLKDNENHAAFVQLLTNGLVDPFFADAGVYFLADAGHLTPLKMKLLNDHQIITTSAKYVSSDLYHLQLAGYLLDLNVGIITPGDKSAMWIYPNPVSETFEVRFQLGSPQNLQFDLYDLQGKHLRTLQDATLFESGDHTLLMRMEDIIPTGKYIFQISSAGHIVSTVKLLRI